MAYRSIIEILPRMPSARWSGATILGAAASVPAPRPLALGGDAVHDLAEALGQLVLAHRIVGLDVHHRALVVHQLDAAVAVRSRDQGCGEAAELDAHAFDRLQVLHPDQLVAQIAQAERLQPLDGADEGLHAQPKRDLAQQVIVGLAPLGLDALEHDLGELLLEVVTGVVWGHSPASRESRLEVA